MAAQPTDITLNGAGYMLAPGSYKRSQDGMAEGRTGRVVMRDFFGGGLRPFQLERDRNFNGLGVGPVFNGQGVWPWPAEATSTLPSGAAAPTTAYRVPAVAIGNIVYFAVGNKVLRTTSMTATNWGQPVEVYAFDPARQITDLFEVHGNIGVCMGTGQQAEVITTAGVYVEPIMGTPKGRHATAYAGHVIMSQARVGGATDTLYLTSPTELETRQLDTRIVNIGLWAGKVVVATRQSLYTFAGRVDEGITGGSGHWLGEFQPFHTEAWSDDADDYPFLIGYGGKLYTWVNKCVAEYNPNGDRAGWRNTGLEGLRCHGGCVAAGLLIVCLETMAGRSQIWAWNGAGWWQIRDADATAIRSISPVNIAGAGNWDLMVFRDGSTTFDLFRLIWRDRSKHALSRAGQFATSMLDAGERDKDKAWRRVGAVFATPELHGAVPDSSTCKLALTCNPGGMSAWVQAATVTKSGNTLANTNFSLEGDVSSAQLVSPFLQLRLTWEVNGGWAPILTALWAEYETLDSPARRRKWSFVVAARDQTIDRAGQLLTRTGRQLIAELWAAWQAGTTLTFRDQDYDADATERRVRIVGIEEAVAKPSDAGRWGESLVKLTLVEV